MTTYSPLRTSVLVLIVSGCVVSTVWAAEEKPLKARRKPATTQAATRPAGIDKGTPAEIEASDNLSGVAEVMESLSAAQKLKMDEIVERVQKRYGKTPDREKVVEAKRELYESVVAILNEEQKARVEIERLRWKDRRRQMEVFTRLLQIGSELLLTRLDKGNYPKDLGTLFLASDSLRPQDFIDPTDDATVPPDFWNKGAAGQAAWINSNTNLVYLAANFKGPVADHIVLLHERFDNPSAKAIFDGGGIEILFGNGTVKHFAAKQAAKVIADGKR